MKKQIECCLLELLNSINMNKPSNFEDLVEFVHDDILQTADIENWNDADVVIGFRRFIEAKL